jgi:hypothetical protein
LLYNYYNLLRKWADNLVQSTRQPGSLWVKIHIPFICQRFNHAFLFEACHRTDCTAQMQTLHSKVSWACMRWEKSTVFLRQEGRMRLKLPITWYIALFGFAFNSRLNWTSRIRPKPMHKIGWPRPFLRTMSWRAMDRIQHGQWCTIYSHPSCWARPLFPSGWEFLHSLM